MKLNLPKEWFERNIHMEDQPFLNGSVVKCIRDCFDVSVDGSELESCECKAGFLYHVEFMVWSSVCGWLIATPKPHESCGNELHKASDFEKFASNIKDENSDVVTWVLGSLEKGVVAEQEELNKLKNFLTLY